MGLTRLCLKNPAAIAVALAVIVLMGFIALRSLPVQLFPNIDRPVMGVQVGWRAASPREIESELIEPIERELRGIPGMRTMQSFSNAGNGFVFMEFTLGTDMDQVFTEVSSRLQRVRQLPADADRPRIVNNGGNAGDTLIYLFMQRLRDTPENRQSLHDLVEHRLVPELEAVPGVGGVDINDNEGERIVRVTFDPYLAAQLGVNIENIAQNVNRSMDVSGGTVEVGRRDYTLRFEGRFATDQLKNVILDWRDGTPIRLGDVADVSVGPDKPTGIVYQNGNPAMGMEVKRNPGANTLEAIDGITKVIDRLNATTFKDMGVAVHKSFDPSVFIKRAISLLTGNLLIGIVLAVGVLWLFIRRVRATLLIASAIPICLLATVIVLNLFGRSINVISLAGLAFATGMTLDAAIVVLENFVRLREEGKQSDSAAQLAVKQVLAALCASTVTTIAIFIPILFFEDVEGQLFADLALTIAIAVSCSLLVAITVLPTGAHLFAKASGAEKATTRARPKFWNKLADFIIRLTNRGWKRVAWVAGLTAGPIALGFLLWPQLNYLPPVKRDAVDVFISFPSGANIDTVRTEFAEVVLKRLDPYMTGAKEPALKNYYFISGPWGGSLGIRAKDQSRVGELLKIVRDEVLVGFPDTQTFAQQGNLFGGFGGDASITLDLQAADYDALGKASLDAVDIIQAALPGSTVRPNPDPQIVNPEIRVTPNDRRIAEVGMTRDSVARAVRALGSGLWLGQYFHDDGKLDIILRAKDWKDPEYLQSVPLATPSGAVVPLGELATISRAVGPSFIRRTDSRRTITLGINPPEGMALGTAVQIIRDKAEPKIYEVLPPGASLKYGGDADALDRAVKNLGGNFLLAVALLFMIMAAMFRSVKDSALVIVALPMAAVGGIVALRILNLIAPTPLDLLGMIGFIILLGLVVNNAILLVAQTRASERDGASRTEAVREALRLRVRPIFMSTLTSIMGMLPLVLSPGAGAMIYRGLATVIVGGMAVSTLFTLVLLPSLLQIGASKVRAAAPLGGALQPAE